MQAIRRIDKSRWNQWDAIGVTGEELRNRVRERYTTAAVTVTSGYYPGRRYEDWVLDNPAGQDLDYVRPICDEILRRVTTLMDKLIS